MKRLDEIAKLVCEYLDCNFDNIKTKKRLKDLVYAKQLISYFARKHIIIAKNKSINLIDVATYLNYKDHVTVVYNVKKIKAWINVYKKVENNCIDLERIIVNSTFENDLIRSIKKSVPIV